MKRILLFGLILVSAAMVASAQSSANQQAMDMLSQAAKDEQARVLREESDSTAALMEQRRTQRISNILSVCTAQSRKRDPFGMSTRKEDDPKPEDMVTAAVAPKPEVSPFLLALRYLPIDGIYPAKKQVWVAGRVITEGDVISISHAGLKFRVQVLSIEANNVVMSDIETEEKAAVALSIIPEGF